MNVLLRQTARVADYVYAGWRQLGALASRAKPTSFHSGHLTPILILPGVYEHWQFMLPIIRELHGAGHPVHVITALGNNRSSVVDGARIASSYLAEHDLSDVVIVAHSKGGLIGKHVMGFGDAPHRIRLMVAIATPFAGSRYARLMPGRMMRAFRPGESTLNALAESLAVNARIVSVYPRFDPHIPEGSELAGARNICVNSSGHFRILHHPKTRAEILRTAA